MTLIPFSQELRERAISGEDASGACFMSDLLTGRGSRDDYIALVAQHFFIYSALESAEREMRDNPEASSFITPRLTRLPAIEADLEFLVGADWRSQLHPLASTRRYVERIELVAGHWAGGFVAHHYTRYLGDLSGGHIIRQVLQRRFGFDTNGVGFFLWESIAEPREFKSTYRAQLDSVAWDDAERERVIDEVRVAYRLSTAVFEELAAEKARAAA